jgi:hypothetical protein
MLSRSIAPMIAIGMRKASWLGGVSLWGLIVALACSSNVTALSGCPDGTKSCPVAGQLTCVSKNDRAYGCASESTCLSCGALGFVHVKQAVCDPFRGTCAVAACEDNYKHCAPAPESGGCETAINSTSTTAVTVVGSAHRRQTGSLRASSGAARFPATQALSIATSTSTTAASARARATAPRVRRNERTHPSCAAFVPHQTSVAGDCHWSLRLPASI